MYVTQASQNPRLDLVRSIDEIIMQRALFVGEASGGKEQDMYKEIDGVANACLRPIPPGKYALLRNNLRQKVDAIRDVGHLEVGGVFELHREIDLLCNVPAAERLGIVTVEQVGPYKAFGRKLVAAVTRQLLVLNSGQIATVGDPGAVRVQQVAGVAAGARGHLLRVAIRELVRGGDDVDSLGRSRVVIFQRHRDIWFRLVRARCLALTL